MINSIKKNSDFKKVYDNKLVFATKNLVMFILKKSNLDMERNRLGISVSKKVGNSIVRHTLVRRMREIFRHNEEKMLKNNDIVVVLRVGSDKVHYNSLNNDFLKLCKKHGILMKEDKVA